jgi:hypothetical protein
MKSLFVVFSFIFCIFILDVQSRRSHKELVALDQAKKLRSRFEHSNSTFFLRKPFLVATFLNASRPISRNTLFTNIEELNGLADFAIIIYDGDQNTVLTVCQSDEKKSLLKSIIHCKRSAATFDPDHSTFPKPVLYPDLLPYLPLYKKTMLIDEDISLKGFNLTDFLHTWNCAFSPSLPPLIVQGLIFESSSQAYPFLHWHVWRDSPHLKDIVASGTNFIEQQIPAFDSIFLLWFIESINSHILTDSLKYESDWGADRFWCSAAREFAQVYYQIDHNKKNHIHNNININNQNKNKNHSSSSFPSHYYTPCALFTQTPPFHHLNSHSLQGKRKNYRTYVQYGRKMMAVWRKFFPSWYIEIEDPSNSTQSHSWNHYRRISAIPKDCQ